jgi:SAM-dependent methyltransferase
MWGTDGSDEFFSGVGSRGRIAEVYVDTMVPIIVAHLSELNANATIVDLGCGDFWVGACLLERLPSVKYIGCDVVPELVEYNRKTFGNNRIEFRLLDIVSSDLPIGDICLVRQVFQHLSNQEIARTLPKLQKYRHVYVTEGYPIVREGKINPDKPTGEGIRFDRMTGRGRGVELDQPPYNLDVDEVCRVPGHGGTTPPGKTIIVTYRIKMSA